MTLGIVTNHKVATLTFRLWKLYHRRVGHHQGGGAWWSPTLTIAGELKMRRYLVTKLFVFVSWMVCFQVIAAEIPPPEQQNLAPRPILSTSDKLRDVQNRLKELNTKMGIPVASYHFTKAQAWLDFALDEYNDNDRTGIVDAALSEADRIVGGMETKTEKVGMETPFVAGSIKVRPDLWAQVERLKEDKSFSCAEENVAQLEVQLIWAGHEEEELGWRHSRPYLKEAERLSKEAEQQVSDCNKPKQEVAVLVPPPPPPPSAPPVEPPPPSASPVEPSPPPALPPPPAEVVALGLLAQQVHFAYDDDMIIHLTAGILDRVASILRQHEDIRTVVRGHADERGSIPYNLVLSRHRAEAVKAYLVAAGIKPQRLSLVALGKSMPLKRKHEEDQLEYYARNRRVDFVFERVSPEKVKLMDQEDDLQIEQIERKKK